MKLTSINWSTIRDRFLVNPTRSVKLAGLSLLLFVLSGLLGVWIYLYAVIPGTFDNGESRLVEIPVKAGLRDIRDILAKNGCIKNDVRFLLTAKLIGTAKSLKAGEYRIRNGLTPYQILLLLESGETVLKSITIPEGLTTTQIADILSTGSWTDRNTFLALTKNPAFIKELGLESDRLEGYLFPDTYHLARGMSPQAIIKMMTKRFQAVANELNLTPGRVPGFSLHEIITLASIVEKESALPFERSMVAAVFLNRLQKGMPLQADPTVIYGLDSFNGNLTRTDLITTTPYNTYTLKGLPKGPICNPGREAIRAVILAADAYRSGISGHTGEYLYFVSKNDGSHYFSKTLAEHNKAVKQYQKNQISPVAKKSFAQAKDTNRLR